MRTRIAGLLTASLAIVMVCGLSAMADDKPGTHEGTVVKVEKDKLTDRLSRSLLDFAKLMETFDKHQVSFASVTQQFNTGQSTYDRRRLTS